MINASQELLRALNVAATEVIGQRKLRRILRKTARLLADETPENGAGPIIGARKDALQVLRSALRLAEIERRRA